MYHAYFILLPCLGVICTLCPTKSLFLAELLGDDISGLSEHRTDTLTKECNINTTINESN